MNAFFVKAIVIQYVIVIQNVHVLIREFLFLLKRFTTMNTKIFTKNHKDLFIKIAPVIYFTHLKQAQKFLKNGYHIVTLGT